MLRNTNQSHVEETIAEWVKLRRQRAERLKKQKNRKIKKTKKKAERSRNQEIGTEIKILTPNELLTIHIFTHFTSHIWS